MLIKHFSQNEVTSNGTPTTISNGSLKTKEKEHKESEPEDQASVKVMGVEITASNEGGKKWSRPTTPLIAPTPPPVQEPKPEPQSIYLEGALPEHSQLLVSDSVTDTEIQEDENEVVLSGKMTLSVINLDNIDKGKLGRV